MESLTGPTEQIFFRCVEDCFEPVMITDRRGILRYVNPAWSLTYGYSKEEAIGQTPRLLRSHHQSGDFYHAMWNTILDPRVGFWRGEVTNKAKDGHLVPVLLTITPYRHASGEIVGYMGIAVDLSEQKNMEQQIIHQDRLASIGMIASGLAHEIGNPLGVMRGRAELLVNQIQGNASAEKNVNVIIGQIDRISRLLQSLLQVSRVPDQLQLREVQLDAVVSEVIALMNEQFRRARIQVKLHDLNHTVLAEYGHLQQLFLNLFINSVHAIEDQIAKSPSPLLKEGETHFIEISAQSIKGGELCKISVRDSGQGISAQNMPRLFQPFYTTKAAGQGTGMGLAVVMKLVEEMQGKISAESEGPGYGATFHLSLKTCHHPLQ